MIVTSTHFLPQFPGMPVYRMADKTIKIPFFNAESKVHFWLGRKEFGANTADSKKINEFMAIFDKAEAMVNQDLKTQKLMQLVPNGEIPQA